MITTKSQLFYAAGQNEERCTATPTRRVVCRIYLSIIPAGTRDTLMQTHPHYPLLRSMTRLPVPDTLRTDRSQPFSIVSWVIADSVVDLHMLLQNVLDCGQGLHKTSTLIPPPDVRRSQRPWHSGIQWSSCSPLSFLHSSPPTGSRSASSCHCGRLGKSCPRRWHL
jgi:hypothetical protein